MLWQLRAPKCLWVNGLDLEAFMRSNIDDEICKPDGHLQEIIDHTKHQCHQNVLPDVITANFDLSLPPMSYPLDPPADC